METSFVVEGNSNRDLINPDQGRAYLKAALNQNNEQVFLRALKDIIISFLNFDDDLKNS